MAEQANDAKPNSQERLRSLTVVSGHCVRLRLITADDAEYVHGLRVNPDISRHLSAVTGTAEDQRSWIMRYKVREADLGELYYVIERLDGHPCGTVRLYDVETNQFTWGSWILDGNKPPKAAFESAVLSFSIGFELLGCETALIDVRIDNTHAESFYRRFGMVETHRTDQDIFFTLSRTQYEAQRREYERVMQSEINE